MLGSSHPEVFCKKVTLKHLCWVSFLRKLQDSCVFINNETTGHMFSCEFSEIFRGNFFATHQQMATSECFLFRDLSQRKHFKSNNNCKSKGNTCTSLKRSFIQKVALLFTFFIDIHDKAPLIFAFFLADSLHIKNTFHCV